jgi:hypothetical protein
MKNKKRIADSRPEGCICEQFAYLLNLRAYPNSSDMNELSEMVGLRKKKIEKGES